MNNRTGEGGWGEGEWRAGPRPAFSGGWPISGGIRLGTLVNHVYFNLVFHLQHIRDLIGINALSGGKSIGFRQRCRST